MVMEMTGPMISRAPISDAATADLPCSMCRWMFSTTTMASSTTRPMASTIASSVSRFSEKPRASMKVAAPMIDSGIVTTGISTERRDPRNRKMTTMTMATASSSVFTTSSMDAWMKRVLS